jgi:hypothetical protein
MRGKIPMRKKKFQSAQEYAKYFSMNIFFSENALSGRVTVHFHSETNETYSFEQVIGAHNLL